MKLRWRLSLAVCVAFACHNHYATAQNIDLENFPKELRNSKPLSISGGISASSVLRTQNVGIDRQSWTNVLTGNVNLNLFHQINLPISFTLTDAGNDLTTPTLPNRLSLHPKYKSITAHLGDVAMVLSPYTLNGYVFRGAGVDIDVKGKYRISALHGRFQKAAEYDSSRLYAPAAFRRMGSGLKFVRVGSDYQAGFTAFTSKDEVGSLRWRPDSASITPMQNLAVSLEGSMRVLNNLNISGELGMSHIITDIRTSNESIASAVVGKNQQAKTFKAMRMSFDYSFAGVNKIGAQYERVDPGYTTMGAYFFNNNFESVALQYGRSIFNNKIQIAINAGLQRDNLDKKQDQSSTQTVYAGTISYNNDILTMTAAYSGFQTAVNLKSNLAQNPDVVLADTMNFVQLTKSTTINLSYRPGNSKNISTIVNADFSFQQTKDDNQNGMGSTRLFNGTLGYSTSNKKSHRSFSTNFIGNMSKSASAATWMIGPMIGYRWKMFGAKITASSSCLYNIQIIDGSIQAKALSARAQFGYILMTKHQINLSFNGIHNQTQQGNSWSQLLSIGYGYSFSSGRDKK